MANGENTKGRGGGKRVGKGGNGEEGRRGGKGVPTGIKCQLLPLEGSYITSMNHWKCHGLYNLSSLIFGLLFNRCIRLDIFKLEGQLFT